MDRGLEHCTGGSDQDHPKKKKCKKARWLYKEDLQTDVKRREAKGKGEQERYTHLNTIDGSPPGSPVTQSNMPH